jgi:ribosomal protein L40E
MEKTNCIHCGADNKPNIKYCTNCGYELPKVKTEEIKEPVHPQPPKSKAQMPKIMGIIAGAIVFAVTTFAVNQLFFKAPAYDKAMMEMASELNKTCPVMVDAETRLDNTVALPVNTFQYNYTLVNYDKAGLDTLTIKNNMEPSLINLVKTSPQMQYQRDHRTTMIYYYKDRSGQYVFSILITPDKYE